MQITLADVEIETFVLEQVRSGRFKSAEEVFRSAINQMQRSLDLKKLDELRAAIKVGTDQLDRGEGKPWNKQEILAAVQARLAAEQVG